MTSVFQNINPLGADSSLDSKTIWELGLSSLLATIAAYYFAPGGGYLTNAVWWGLGNGLIFIVSVVLIQKFGL